VSSLFFQNRCFCVFAACNLDAIKIDLSTFASDMLSAQTSPVYLVQATLIQQSIGIERERPSLSFYFHDLHNCSALLLCNPRINNDSR